MISVYSLRWYCECQIQPYRWVEYSLLKPVQIHCHKKEIIPIGILSRRSGLDLRMVDMLSRSLIVTITFANAIKPHFGFSKCSLHLSFTRDRHYWRIKCAIPMVPKVDIENLSGNEKELAAAVDKHCVTKRV